MDLHPVKTRFNRSAGSQDKVVLERFDFFGRQRTGRAGLYRAGLTVLVVGIGQRIGRQLIAGGHRGAAIGLQSGVRYPAHVPELGEDLAAVFMHGAGDVFPAFNLLLGVKAGVEQIAAALNGNRNPFADDQPCACPLAVIEHHQRVRHGSQRACASYGRHHDTVLQF